MPRVRTALECTPLGDFHFNRGSRNDSPGFEIFWIFGKKETGVLERIKVIKRRLVRVHPFYFNRGSR